MRLGERSVAYLLGGGRAHLCRLRVRDLVSERFAWHSPHARASSARHRALKGTAKCGIIAARFCDEHEHQAASMEGGHESGHGKKDAATLQREMEEERRHFTDIVTAYAWYERLVLAYIAKMDANFRKIPEHYKKQVTRWPERIVRLRKACTANQGFIDMMLEDEQIFENRNLVRLSARPPNQLMSYSLLHQTLCRARRTRGTACLPMGRIQASRTWRRSKAR